MTISGTGNGVGWVCGLVFVDIQVGLYYMESHLKTILTREITRESN